VTLGIGLDGAHLLAYFAGRIVGLTWLLRHRRQPAPPARVPEPDSVGRP
jgi:hypothetical protein